MGIRGMEWIIIFAIVLLLFGANKIPQLMKGLGEGVKEFKKGLKDAPEEKPKTEEAKAAGDAKHS